MAQEKIIIKFEPKGHKPLIDALNKLANAQKRLTSENIKYTKETPMGIRNNRLLANSFATLRSKMLLFSFAMSMGLRQLIAFTKEAAKVESMGRAFKTLSGGAESGSAAMDKLQKATNGTMSQFNLFQQANNAMILGVAKNSDEMAEMFDIAQRLGRALGRDTASSVESLITGIGRQSRLMLDNIGIIVKAEEAYEDYAKKLDISVDKLTDAQKKQAFLNATMESARQKVATLGSETLTTQDSYDKLESSSSNATVALGGFVSTIFNLPSLAEQSATALDKISEKMNKISFAQGVLNEETINAVSSEGMLLFAIKEVENEMNNLQKSVHKMWGETWQEAFGERATDKQKENMKGLTKELELLFNRLNEINILMTGGEDKPQVFAPEPLEKAEDLFSKIGKEISTIVKEGKLADKAISALANEMARLVMEGENLTKIKPGKVIGQMVLASVFSGIGGFIGGGILSALGIAHKGGLITDNGKVQRFATGGTVRGGDNVPILAQGGEFVMQRSAVESIGIENLNRMNQGGGGSSVTVNISAPLVDETVVDTIIPAINEAVRRGETLATS